MTEAHCPFPIVEEVLRPYMRPRQEVEEIRTSNVQYLASLTQSTTHLDLVVPYTRPEPSNPADIPPSIYRKYLDALAAHQLAKERYAALRIELDDLQQSSIDEEQTIERISPSLREHIDLLRRRTTHRRLQVLSETLNTLQSTANNPSQIELKPHLRSQLGEPPDPPQGFISPLEDHDGTQSIPSLVTTLKKRLIVAHTSLLETEKSCSEVTELAKELADPGVHVQVAALRDTRDRLIAWVEGELSKVPEDESVIEDEELDEYINGGQAHQMAEEVDQEVQDLYRCYVDVRAVLLDKVHVLREETTHHRHKHASHTTQHESPTISRTQPTQSRTRSSTTSPSTSDPNTMTASTLLPYLPTLITTHRNETALQLQSTYLRRQLATANEETSRTMQRLAGESYLVPPGATGMEAWARAAAEAGRKTALVVEEQTEAGREALVSAAGVLRKVRERRDALGGMKVLR